MQVKRRSRREPFTQSDERHMTVARGRDGFGRFVNGAAVESGDLKALTTLAPFSTASDDEVRAILERAGQPGYRTQQAQQWFWGQLVPAFEAMRTLPAPAQRALAAAFTPSTVEAHLKRVADRGQTTKYLFKLRDRRMIETVVMRYPATARSRARTTICVSSQVGCPIGCRFCATGQSGFDRNLTPAEIVDQLLAAARDLEEGPRAISNVVFMGMGEPMNNYAAVVSAIRRWADPATLRLSPRRVTVSTIGLVPLIERLSGEGLPVNLAISLHAPDDELRSTLIPVNRKYPISDVINAAQAFGSRTGRRTSYEYVLLRGINDSPEQARQLARRLPRRLSHVNLIPMNPIEGASFGPPVRARAQAFQAILQEAGIPTTIRATRGLDIDAACGQLRARSLQLTPA
jgi:23S rRNA (adenine2503-C2)-methyltransferase